MQTYTSPKIADHADLQSALTLLSAWADHKRSEMNIPGISLGVVYDQELLWARGFGLNSIEKGQPAEADSLYRIASITKLFTSIAILQLRDAGKLRLDDPLTEHLPWFTIRYRHADAKAITLRHMLSHTSGLPRDSHTPMWTEVVYPDRETMIEALKDRETALPPETRWKYSNLAFALLGEVVAAVSGMEYADYIQKNILDPLKMNDTIVLPRDGQDPRLSTGYTRPDKDNKRHPSPFMDAAGFAPAFTNASNVTDLAKFVSFNFCYEQSGPVLRGSTLKEMHRVQWLEDDWMNGWGLGFSLRRDSKGRVWVGHGGGAPGHTTNVQFSPADKFGVITLTNVVAGDPMAFSQQAIDSLLEPALKALKPQEESPTFDPAWERYLGTYVGRWGDSFVGRQNNRLVMQSIAYPTMPPGVLIPEGEHTFRMERGGNDGELVVFVLDDAGKVARVTIAGEYSLRAED